MNARITLAAAVGFVLSGALGIAVAAPAPDIDAPGQSADTNVPHGAPAAKAANATAASPSPADVGDADSFGRNVLWLGLTDGNVDLAADCTGDTFPCTVLAPPPAATSFSYTDLGHITLPAKAAHSLLCYWFSPFLTIGYGNDGAAPVVAHLNYTPTVTIENPMLNDPSLIDPTTGLPFGGSLLTGMTSSETFETPLEPGTHVTERTRDSAVCIAGLISKSTLMTTYGFTDNQAKDFFKQQMTLRLNVSGTAQYVDFAALYFGWRIVGD
jgi:hypothetical protein